MDREMKRFLTNVVNEKSMTVINGCLSSMKVSVDLSNISEAEKEKMFNLILLIENHLDKVDSYLKRSIKHLK